MEYGFLKLVKNETTQLFIHDMKAWYLLSMVALQANRHLVTNRAGLLQNQAWISKKTVPSLSEKEYRGAKKRLEKGGLVSFKGRGTGTVATLLNREVYDINAEEGQAEGVQKAETGQTEGKKRATNKKKEKEKEKEIKYILEFLNEVCKTNFKHTTAKTQNLIKTRLLEGFSLEDFQEVIHKKNKEWKGSEFEQYLRPETLFGGKFESYLNQKEVTNANSNGHDQVSEYLKENARKLREAEERESTRA